MSKFTSYVDQVLTADEQDPEPTCPFPLNNGECYTDRRAREKAALIVSGH